jgi:Lhr-like helicase
LPAEVANFLTALADESDDLLFNPPYEHQARALEHSMRNDSAGTGIVVTTGTGSGKTESFLLPVLGRLADEAIRRPAQFHQRAVRALLLYPMNALVNDQLGRLRNLFGATSVRKAFSDAGGRPAKFGRYTGRTLYPGARSGRRDQERLKTLGYYLKIEDAARDGSETDRRLVETLKSKGRWPGKPDSVVGAYDGLRRWYGTTGQRWEDESENPLRANERPDDPELLTRHEIQGECPDLLVTNYSMLEYMLLRPIEREIFSKTRDYFEANPGEKFILILDEAHLYRGANGTEVAYLVRRLLERLGLTSSQVLFIATSASFSNAERAQQFVAGLCGIEPDHVVALSGNKKATDVAGPGPAELAGQLASVPLNALQSTDLIERSSVIVPLLEDRSDIAGEIVRLERLDSGPDAVIVTVGGLSTSGQRIAESVVVNSKAQASTREAFLVVDDVTSSGGVVRVVRRYPIGTVQPEGYQSDADDLPNALAEVLSPLPVIGRLRNATSGAASECDPVPYQGAAWPLTDLPALLFPNADSAVAATDALLELASLARTSPDKPPLLPARVHMLFRGLPGLWACTNSNCDQIDEGLRGGPTGKLFAEPRRTCGCGSQVFELHSCRSCGLAVAKANIGSPAGVEHLWQDNGFSYAGDTGQIEPVHVCLEDPRGQTAGAVRPVYLDLGTGRIDGNGGSAREIWLPALLGSKLFERCPRCGADCSPTSAQGISDLQTKGEQPFQELITVQVLEQPPRPNSDAPLKGRKALVFSDGRQTASRLAGTLKDFSFRDSVRPLLLAGMSELKRPIFTPSLDDTPLAIALGGAKHGVRLRPTGAEDGRMDRAGREALALINDPVAAHEDFQFLSAQTSRETTLSVFSSIYAVLQDEHTGLSSLALATIAPKLSRLQTQTIAASLALPAIAGLSEDEGRNALIQLWLWQALRKRAIKIANTPANVETGRGSSGIRPWNGKFSKKFETLLESRGLKNWLKNDFYTNGVSILRDVFSPGGASDFFVQGATVSLTSDINTVWIRCDRCTTVSPRNELIGDQCTTCGGIATSIDPWSDIRFRSRKAFFRRLWERMSDPADGYAPHQLIAEEHSAALNDSGLANAMSRNEAYELRFQDVPIEQDGRVGAPIDILSCTTTMEVGIDIGGLTAVALRNVPPGRANYQQRAGRAGRRGAGLSTVIMFCGADSHDQTHFRDPAPIVAGPAPDPILNLDNVVIARRQAFGFLIGRFQQDRIDDVDSGSDVFASLGSVADFVGGSSSEFSLAGLREWIELNREDLDKDIQRLFGRSCPALNSRAVLAELPELLQRSLILDSNDADDVSAPFVADVGSDDVIDEIVEEGADDDRSPEVDDGRLLDRLFALGLLPKYAFPTDVAAFSVFEDDANPWRPKRRYSPQQALNAALSQYAPGHEVWVDGKRFLSLGIYSERESDRLQAYREKRLYFQCRVCNYADLLAWSEGYVDQTRDCPACSGRATLGPARRWMRPPGFSHPPTITALPPDFDAGMRLRPTKATLDSLTFEPGSSVGGESWPIGTGWEGWSDSKNLVVTNRGSLNAANPTFNYCTQCGRIEPADFDPLVKQLGSGGLHDRPRPRRPKEPEQCSGSVKKIVLGNEFRTDVAVFRLALPLDWRFDPDLPSTIIAARSAVEALRRAACQLEDLEPNDIDGDFRFAPRNTEQQFIDLYLYDQAAGGAGFVKAAARNPRRLVERAIKLLDDCICDDSCYQCLRSYKNRFDHAMFDRFIGGDLLKACFNGTPPTIPDGREEVALSKLAHDLDESGAKIERIEGGLLDGASRFICLAHPFNDTEPSTSSAKKSAVGKETAIVDILLVLRALPVATNVALAGASNSSVINLAPDPNGVPQITGQMVSHGNLAGDPSTPRFAVAGASDGDFLFRVTGNMLTGKNGDGRNGNVPNGALCLFRPFSDTPTKTDVYLIRRPDGAFGATSASWTVGMLQTSDDAIRIRYRAASQHMECVSELVKPANAVQVLAQFVKVVA